jgi:hypothetical protein
VQPNLLAVTVIKDEYTFRVGVFKLAAVFARSPGTTAGRIAVKVRLSDNLLAYYDGPSLGSFPDPLWLRIYGNWHRWYFDTLGFVDVNRSKKKSLSFHSVI